MESRFGCLSIVELKNELRKRNARLSGRKSELVDRLVAYERNKNFGQPDVKEPDYSIKVPQEDTYTDLNADSKFRGVKKDDILLYLRKFNKELEPHIQSLYDEKYIKYVRLSTDDDDADVFIKASCHAEMKRGICYSIDIRLSSSNLILESQCECAAGMGPTAHCKHVCVVLFALSVFSKRRSILTEETCTQKLQTFHKCKKFTGSPLKANSLNLSGAHEFTNIDFDPRPENMRNNPSYQDFFRNACLNFPGISETPIFQCFEPANTLAVAHDHDYFELTHEDHFLEVMQISKISEEQVNKIQQKTIGQSSNSIWRDERTKRLPSSMFGRICKATERTNKEELARSLCQVKEIKAKSIDHGRKHEHIALQHFAEQTGYSIKPCGLFVCQSVPYISSSPDGIIENDHIVEIKCPFTAKDKDISPTTVPYLKLNEDGQFYLEESHDYYFQIQGQLLCTGAKKCTLVVCAAANLKVKDIKFFDIYRNDQFISKMINDLSLFYNKYFKNAFLEKYFYKSY